MEKSQVVEELDRLLDESLEAASLRVSTRLSLREGDALVLYGAGTLGRAVRNKLGDMDIKPVAFADDTPAKLGQIIDGLPVMTPEHATMTFGNRTIFVVTILNPALRFLDAKRRLETLTGARVLSFLDLAWQHSEGFLPYHQFELPQRVLTKGCAIRRAFNLWEDEESRRQFVGHLKFRLLLDYEALPKNSGDNYFPPDVLPPLPPDTTFVDCGAYTGDSIHHFLERQQDRFSEIFALEPDGLNCQKLVAYVSGLAPHVARRIHIHQAAVGNRRARMRFNATGDTGAAFDEAGATEIEVIPIQEIVDWRRPSIYIKLDVEGAERRALEGMRALIGEARPLVALSIYHQPDDLWELPVYLKSLNPSYKLFLRTQGEDGMDAICYGVSQLNDE